MEIVIKMSEKKGRLLKRCIEQYLELSQTQVLFHTHKEQIELEQLVEILSQKLNK